MRYRVWLSACVVVGTGVIATTEQALAGPAFASNGTFGNFQNLSPVDGSVSEANDGTNLGADDGAIYGLQVFNTVTDPVTFTLTVVFGNESPAGDSAVVLFMNTVDTTGGGLYFLDLLTWRVSSSPTVRAEFTPSSPIDLSTYADNNQNQVPGTTTTGNWTTFNGFTFGSTLYDELVLNLRFSDGGGSGNTFNAGGARLQFDAISNPEPGTMALFGLGALGLGGMAWRRRKARLAAKRVD